MFTPHFSRLPVVNHGSRQLYEGEFPNRVENAQVGEIYTGVFTPSGQTSPNEVLTFTVQLEYSTHFEEDLKKNPNPLIGASMLLLTKDWQKSIYNSFDGLVVNGVWDLISPISLLKGTQPISQGFLIPFLPYSNPVESIVTKDDHDPRSITY